MRQKEKGREEIYFLFICLRCETPSLIHSLLHCSFLCVADEVPSTLKRLCSWYPTNTEDAFLSNTHTHTSTILFSFFFLHTSLCLSISSFLLCSLGLLVTSPPSQHRYECQTTKRYHRKSVGKHWHHRWEGEKGGERPSVCLFPSFEWHCCFSSVFLIIIYLLAEMRELSLPWNANNPHINQILYTTLKFRSRTSFWLFLWWL